MSLTYLILGSNSNDKEFILPQAIALLSTTLGEIITKSSIYETEPWGYESRNTYHNQVVLCKTSHNSKETLKITQGIEITLGRKNKSTGGIYSDRPIDIDILYFDKEIIHTPTLIIPHQHLQDRKFVLEPLAEIAANFEHPMLKKTTQELLSACQDSCIAKRL